MPITKVPIVHKFGIISHTQRLELQERLLKQSYLQTLKSQKVLVPTRNPLEVSEDFVQQYNNAKDLDEKEKYEQTAHKMLERSKRRAGIRDGGTGQYVNLPMAWTELAQLAQCRGKIQEECLDVLITSLDQSPLEKYHIPALFFLAETMLYWLRTDAVHQPYLRTGEIKLLKMGQLVFACLFYHHMAGQLAGQKDFKNRLFTYLDGLQDCQEAYSPYPNALLSMRFIITVGKIIMADAQLEPGDIKEGDNIPSVQKSPLSRPSAKSRDTGERMTGDRMTGDRTTYSKEHTTHTTHTSHSGAISSSVHDLSPTLWHALDVWRCTNHLSGGLSEALKALSHCGMGLVNESWVDSMIALQILAEAAKCSLQAMKTLHNMAQGFRPRDETQSPQASTRSESSVHKDMKDHEMYSITSEDSAPRGQDSRASLASSKPTLSDIYERSEEGDSDRRKSSNKTSAKTGSSKLNQFISPGDDSSDKLPSEPDNGVEEKENIPDQSNKHTPRDSSRREVSFNVKAKKTPDQPDVRLTPKSTPGPRAPTQSSRQTGVSVDSNIPPGTGWRAEAGTELSNGRASDASTVQTYTNVVNPDTPGINGWHWEVAITYTDILADICLHGNSAEIQKMALMGVNKETADPFKRGFTSVPLPSAGLLDLAFFRALNEAKDGGPNDWSWRIRFGAVQSMVKICRSLANDKNREGIRTAAWNILLRAHSLEKDDRVLEALKVGQVHTDIEGLLSKQLTTSPYTLGSKVAAGLSVIYLPPLPPPVDTYIPPRRREKTPIQANPSSTLQESSVEVKSEPKPMRTSLKEEIMLATALYEPPVQFNVRTSFDLRRIVEDQWRKELQQQLEEEEAERQKALKERQKEEEEFQRQMAIKKAQKFQKGQNKDSTSSE